MAGTNAERGALPPRRRWCAGGTVWRHGWLDIQLYYRLCSKHRAAGRARGFSTMARSQLGTLSAPPFLMCATKSCAYEPVQVAGCPQTQPAFSSESDFDASDILCFCRHSSSSADVRNRPPGPRGRRTAWLCRDLCRYGRRAVSILFCSSALARCWRRLRMAAYCFAFTYTGSCIATTTAGVRAVGIAAGPSPYSNFTPHPSTLEQT